MQPLLGTGVEVLLWLGIFQTSGPTFGGFSMQDYLAYVIWSPFISRITSTWLYEYKMIAEIDNGSINGLLVRPMSFFEYYLSQFLGYKFFTTSVSLVIPVGFILYFRLPTDFSRLPIVLVSIFYFLILVQMMSFTIATFAFYLNKVYSLTAAKNFLLWFLTGELLPLDIVPEPYRSWIIGLPFCNAVYLPVGYLTGRLSKEIFLRGFITTTYGILFFAVAGIILWKQGLKKYVGTGA